MCTNPRGFILQDQDVIPSSLKITCDSRKLQSKFHWFVHVRPVGFYDVLGVDSRLYYVQLLKCRLVYTVQSVLSPCGKHKVPPFLWEVRRKSVLCRKDVYV